MTERTIFLNTIEHTDPAARAAYLDVACAGDPALRKRVESLLRSNADPGGFLDVPAVEQLAAHAASRSRGNTASGSAMSGGMILGNAFPGNAVPGKEQAMGQESSVIGVYANIDQADEAVQKLGQGGFPIQHVSVIAQNLGSERKVHGFVTSCDVAKSSARTGAWVGGIFGALVGAAFIWVPGVGPMIVAGSLAAALLGGVQGAVAGAAGVGVLGWLASLGISKQHIVKYEESIRAGKVLLIAHGTPEEIGKAQTILTDTAPSELTAHVAA
jgi:hypothetical protein